MFKISIFLGKGYVITVHREPFPKFAAMEKKWDDKYKSRDILWLVNRVVTEIIGTYRQEMQRMEALMDLIETKLTTVLSK